MTEPGFGVRFWPGAARGLQPQRPGYPRVRPGPRWRRVLTWLTPNVAIGHWHDLPSLLRRRPSTHSSGSPANPREVLVMHMTAAPEVAIPDTDALASGGWSSFLRILVPVRLAGDAA